MDVALRTENIAECRTVRASQVRRLSVNSAVNTYLSVTRPSGSTEVLFITRSTGSVELRPVFE